MSTHCTCPHLLSWHTTNGCAWGRCKCTYTTGRAEAPAPISSETGAVSAIADHSSGESVPSTPDGATRPPDIGPTVEAGGAADGVYRSYEPPDEPDGGPIEAFALALDIDSWDEAVDLAQRSVPNLSNIGWVLAPRKVIHDLLIPAYEGFGRAISDPSLVKFVKDWLYAWKAGCELLGLPTDLDTMDSQPMSRRLTRGHPYSGQGSPHLCGMCGHPERDHPGLSA